MVALEIFGLPRRFDFKNQNNLKAFLCQLITVSGLTITKADFQLGKSFVRKIHFNFNINMIP